MVLCELSKSWYFHLEICVNISSTGISPLIIFAGKNFNSMILLKGNNATICKMCKWLFRNDSNWNVSNGLNKALKQNMFCTPQNNNFSDICLEKFLPVYFNDRMTSSKKYPLGTFPVVRWVRLCFQWKGHRFDPQLGIQDPTYQVGWPKNRNQNLRSILSANDVTKLNYLLSAFIFY